jgi:hypothetical protein
MVNDFTNSNKKDDYLSSQIIEHKKTTTYLQVFGWDRHLSPQLIEHKKTTTYLQVFGWDRHIHVVVLKWLMRS